jgi:diguanylate cyclase (GGDEF)-like protein/PAS domain S-box-containing protein
MTIHEPTRKRRQPSTAGPPDERSGFFGRRAFELARDASCIVDFVGVLRGANPALEQVLGYGRNALVGRELADLVHPDDWPRTAEEARKMADGGHPIAHFETRCRSADGQWVWLDWSAHASPIEGLIYASARNVGARKARELQLERAAHLDPLTGLANRRGFERALERELAAAKRHSLSPALVVLDLDRFKTINDAHGHKVGDELLAATAEMLQATLRASDMAARIGGDEFAVVLPDCDPQTAALVAAKIVAALRRCRLEADGGSVNVSASAGVALLGQRGINTGADLIAAADHAMYRAKRTRDSFAVHDGPVA